MMIKYLPENMQLVPQIEKGRQGWFKNILASPIWQQQQLLEY
jgi:hypothetical protein